MYNTPPRRTVCCGSRPSVTGSCLFHIRGATKLDNFHCYLSVSRHSSTGTHRIPVKRKIHPHLTSIMYESSRSKTPNSFILPAVLTPVRMNHHLS